MDSLEFEVALATVANSFSDDSFRILFLRCAVLSGISIPLRLTGVNNLESEIFNLLLRSSVDFDDELSDTVGDA